MLAADRARRQDKRDIIALAVWAAFLIFGALAITHS